MNETELREALGTVLAASRPPRPMAAATTMAAGRRAVRRRTALTSVGLAAVLAVGAGTAVAVTVLPGSGRSGTGGSDGAAGAPQASSPPAQASSPPSPEASVKPVETATSGPQFERGRELLEKLLDAVPDGYTAPTGNVPLKPKSGPPVFDDDQDEVRMRDHEEGNSTYTSGHWVYQANAAIAKNSRTGLLLTEVHTKGNTWPADPCALAKSFWNMGGKCEIVSSGDAEVGVITGSPDVSRVEQWAAFRHPDGVVVFMAQARQVTRTPNKLHPMTELPLSKQQLAALATDSRFHLR